MKYKSQNSNTKLLISIILELSVLFITMITPGSITKLSLMIIIFSLIVFNILFFKHKHISPQMDFIMKNIFNVILYMYIMIVGQKHLGFLFLFAGVLIYKNIINYCTKTNANILYFVGSYDTYDTIRHIYNNQDTEFIMYDDTSSSPSNQSILFEHEKDYINYILQHNSSNVKLLNASANVNEFLFKKTIVDRYKVGVLNQEFWSNKNIYIICNDHKMIQETYAKISQNNELKINVFTTNAELSIQNLNILVEYIDVNNLDEYTKNMMIKQNVMILDLYYINNSNSFNKNYFKILKFLIDTQRSIPSLLLFSCISHGYSLESFLLNEARAMCLGGKCFVYKSGLIIDYLFSNINNSIKTLSEYRITSIDNITNMIAYELPLIINQKIMFVENNIISTKELSNIYNVNFEIQKYKLSYEAINIYKQYTQVKIVNNDQISNIVNNILNGEITGIGSKILASINLVANI